jgi:hypothetical protein
MFSNGHTKKEEKKKKGNEPQKQLSRTIKHMKINI